jgi:transposase InsO family protein
MSRKVRKVEAEQRKPKGLQGRRFTAEQRKEALKLIGTGLTKTQIAKVSGTTIESLRRWEKEAAAKGGNGRKGVTPSGGGDEAVVAAVEVTGPQARPETVKRSPYAPSDPGHGLSEQEQATVLEYKRKHPSMGPAQLRAQLKRFHGWRISIKAIARVLKANGYELVHRGSRPKGPEPIRFEAVRRNALWQADFAQMRVGAEVLHVLLILDDFSRYVVGHAAADSPSSQVAAKAMREAIARHGKPEAVRTDRGGAFTAFGKDADFGTLLEAELIDHIVGKPYRPQGGGKVESAIGTLRRELWDLEHFADRAQAEARLRSFLAEYNDRRAHMGIDGLTPADRFMGRADRVLAAIDAISRKRQGNLAQLEPLGGAIEEVLGQATGAPMEVLRLMIVDGFMELRFCGARVRLGRVQS